MSTDSSPFPRRLTVIISLIVGGAALARGAALMLDRVIDLRAPGRESIEIYSDLLRRGTSDIRHSISSTGIHWVDRLRFDESAEVILTRGADGKPGQADIDDNRDAMIDNVSEIGAVGSDDQCFAPWDRAYVVAKGKNGTVPISKGTFVLDDQDSVAIADRYLLHMTTGDAGEATWSWMLIVD